MSLLMYKQYYYVGAVDRLRFQVVGLPIGYMQMPLKAGQHLRSGACWIQLGAFEDWNAEAILRSHPCLCRSRQKVGHLSQMSSRKLRSRSRQ